MVHSDQMLEYVSLERSDNVLFFGTPACELENSVEKQVLLWRVDISLFSNIISLLTETSPATNILVPVFLGASRLTILKDRYMKRLNNNVSDKNRHNFLRRLKNEYQLWNCSRACLNSYLVDNSEDPLKTAKIIPDSIFVDDLL